MWSVFTAKEEKDEPEQWSASCLLTRASLRTLSTAWVTSATEERIRTPARSFRVWRRLVRFVRVGSLQKISPAPPISPRPTKYWPEINFYVKLEVSSNLYLMPARSYLYPSPISIFNLQKCFYVELVNVNVYHADVEHVWLTVTGLFSIQSRYVGYYERVVKRGRELPEEVPLVVTGFTLRGIRNIGKGDGSDFSISIKSRFHVIAYEASLSTGKNCKVSPLNKSGSAITDFSSVHFQ